VIAVAFRPGVGDDRAFADSIHFRERNATGWLLQQPVFRVGRSLDRGAVGRVDAAIDFVLRHDALFLASVGEVPPVEKHRCAARLGDRREE
jgi:hypothetical protein